MPELAKNIYYLGAQDPDRRTFDALMHLPVGTSYNAFFVRGSAKTALIDTVEPRKTGPWLKELQQLTQHIDYIVSLHAEQDHSGSIPAVLKAYPGAKVVTNQKCKDLLKDHLELADDVFIVIKDRETLSLGDKTLEFFLTPWVHWPESMFALVREDGILFTTDFLGAHETADKMFCMDRSSCLSGAKRYYAEIMMPFRIQVKKYLDLIATLSVKFICPCHGPLYNDPEQILVPYREWAADMPKNKVLIAYVTMHESTRIMTNYLSETLRKKGIDVDIVNLETEPSGQLAMHLVDAATLVLGCPAVLAGPHPVIASAAILANALRPKTKYFSIIGSYGWGHKSVEQLTALTSLLIVERLTPVYAKGLPKPADFAALDILAQTIAEKHRTLNA